ncbi:thioredoxin family protein [Planctomycetota bacterium]
MDRWTDKNFDTEVIQNKLPVVVGFLREGCAASEKMMAIWQELAQDQAGLVVGSVDIDTQPATAEKYAIKSTPTTIIVHSGKVTHEFVGIRQKVEITSAVRATINP